MGADKDPAMLPEPAELAGMLEQRYTYDPRKAKTLADEIRGGHYLAEKDSQGWKEGWDMFVSP